MRAEGQGLYYRRHGGPAGSGARAAARSSTTTPLQKEEAYDERKRIAIQVRPR